MKIGIFGNHPDINFGFDSAMCMNQISGFSRDHEVILFIHKEFVRQKYPSHNIHRIAEKINRFGMNFDVQFISHESEFDRDLSFLIWQTYRQDLEQVFPRKRSFLVTKNVPRFMANTSAKYERKLRNNLRKYDCLAMSWRIDAEIISSSFSWAQGLVDYVPRGFDSAWLTPAKPEVPLVCVDAAVKSEDGGERAVKHVLECVQKLRRRGLDLKLAATRGAARWLDADMRIPAMPLHDFYDSFIRPGWIYLPCDFNYSVHSKNLDFDEEGRPVYIGIFENQIVEFQMAGGVPVLRKNDVDQNILFSGDCLVNSYDDDELADRVERTIDNFAVLSAQAREFAKREHSLDKMCSSWLALVSSARSRKGMA